MITGRVRVPTYYLCPIHLREQMRWCIWFTNDQDGMVVRSAKIPLFASETQAREFAAGLRLPLEPEAQAPFQFDRALGWLETGRAGAVDCPAFLDLFNLCTDGVSSLGQRASWERAEFNPVYDKLFFGCNLPGITPPGKRYIPFWPRRELRTLRKSLRLAIDQFLAAVEFITEPDDLTEARS